MQQTLENGVFLSKARGALARWFLLCLFGLSFALLFSPFIRLTEGGWMTVLGGNILLAAFAIGLWLKGAKLSQQWHTFAIRFSTVVQFSVQTSILIFICIFDRRGMVANWSGFLLYQLCFALIFDCLVRLAQGRPCTPQLYIFPMTLSINLFIWLKPPFLFLHLLLIIIGVVGKNCIRKSNGQTHLFNPSAFPLTIASLVFMLLNFKEHILAMDFFYNPTPLFPFFLLIFSCFTLWLPNSYLISAGALFCYSLCFNISKTLILPLGGEFSHLPLYISGSIFIGFTLLVTDPRTSPSKPVGKFLFGIAYAALNTIIFYLLLSLPLDPFYGYFAKILPVPILNIFVSRFDIFAARFDSLATRCEKAFKLNFLSGKNSAFYFSRLLPMALYLLAFFWTVNWMLCARCGSYGLSRGPWMVEIF